LIINSEDLSNVYIREFVYTFVYHSPCMEMKFNLM